MTERAPALHRNVEDEVVELCRQAREAAFTVAQAGTNEKNRVLELAAKALRRDADAIAAANAEDLARVTEGTAAFRDRLTLTPARVEAMAAGVAQVAELPDPVGETIHAWRRPNGLEIQQVRVPLGVIGIVYESRPNVTADAAALCLKSGNAVVLKGGSEAIATNAAIADRFEQALEQAGLPPAAVALVRTTDRAAARAMLRQKDSIDVLIPRGGESLIRAITEESTIPVIQHFSGVCQIYVDAAADLDRAESIAVNAKAQRPGVCNAMENLLVHRDVAATFLPRIVAALRAVDVEIRGCAETRRIVGDVTAATDEDWDTEYLDRILSVRVVDDLADAVAFIRRHGSGLADAIVTQDVDVARRFTSAVDSSYVAVNASTRFNDGFEFGFGAEIGISTNRLHARGPMGLRELTTYKYVVWGSGQIRE